MQMNRCVNCMHETATYPCPYCGYDIRDLTADLQILSPGTMLHDRYQVGRKLGQGGFGITYVGWDLKDRKKVAVKEFFPSGQVSRYTGTASNELIWNTNPQTQAFRQTGIDSFLREGRKMDKVSQVRHVVHIIDSFQENSTAYLVMDFVEGITLKEYVMKYGPLPWAHARRVFFPAIAAMHQVHEAGIIHRDISPDNIMVQPDGWIKILDLGAAKDLTVNSGASSMLVAKGGFSPLEQYGQRGGSGAWTDVYAMAATMYYCMTGVIPPMAVDRLDADTLRFDVPGLIGLPAPVISALQHALAVASRDRTQTMGDFLLDLQSDGKPPKPTKPPKHEKKKQRGEKLRGVLVSAAAAAVVVALAGGLYLAREPLAELFRGNDRNEPAVRSDRFAGKETEAPDEPGETELPTRQIPEAVEVPASELERVETRTSGGALLRVTMEDSDGNCHRVEEYDITGRVTSIRTFRFNADGREIGWTEFRTDGQIRERAESQLDSKGDAVRTEFFDGSGELLRVWNREYTNGVEVRRECTDPDDNPVFTEMIQTVDGKKQIFTYAPDHTTICMKEYDADDRILVSWQYKDNRPDAHTEYEWDSNGILRKTTEYASGDKLSSILTYNDCGAKQRAEYYNDTGNMYEVIDYTYSDEGWVQHFIAHVGDVILFKGEEDRRETEYSTTYYERDGSVSYVRRSEIDAYDRAVKATDYTADGVLKGWVTFEYDGMDHMIRYTSYAPDGAMTGGYEQEYDVAGNFVSRTFFDADGNPK